jgi:hypothetical protein
MSSVTALEKGKGPELEDPRVRQTLDGDIRVFVDDSSMSGHVQLTYAKYNSEQSVFADPVAFTSFDITTGAIEYIDVSAMCSSLGLEKRILRDLEKEYKNRKIKTMIVYPEWLFPNHKSDYAYAEQMCKKSGFEYLYGDVALWRTLRGVFSQTNANAMVKDVFS